MKPIHVYIGLIVLYTAVVITLLHVREQHEQWKQSHIDMATGGQDAYDVYR